MNPYLQDADCTIYRGDALETLRQLPDESVHMCCTSPPFYGLRDYGVDGQIGLEPTPDEWVDRLVDVFREVRRVMRHDATLWLEVGDSFGTKQLRGTPWKLAFALQNDGWYLRSEIIWAKPNPMPESVGDRPTVSHSRVFLLSKSASYFYDAEAIRESDAGLPSGNGFRGRQGTAAYHVVDGGEGTDERFQPGTGRNRRSVWTIPTEPYPEAHFATWPHKLVEPMILAGTSERGVCPECGAPWERVVEVGDIVADAPGYHPRGVDAGGMVKFNPAPNHHRPIRTLGWQPTCEHYQFGDDGPDNGTDGETSPVRLRGTAVLSGAPVVPGVILDPFGGSGTTAYVARRLGRRSILIELSEEYCLLAADRLKQQSLFASPNEEKASSGSPSTESQVS